MGQPVKTFNVLINVPYHLVRGNKRTNIFVEISAALVGFNGNTAMYHIIANNVNLDHARIIDWDEFAYLVEQIIDEHIKGTYFTTKEKS